MDKTRVILTGDKRVPMVDIDKQDYINKAENLTQKATYRPVPTDPTNKYKAKLINTLKRIKKKLSMGDKTYRNMYPTGACSPRMYGFLRIYKKGHPVRPIVSSWDSVTYRVAKVIACFFQPLVRKSKHHIQNILCRTNSGHCNRTREVCHIIWQYSPIHISPSSCSLQYSNKIRTGSGSTLKDQARSTVCQRTAKVLPPHQLFPLSRYFKHMQGVTMWSSTSSIIANMYRNILSPLKQQRTLLGYGEVMCEWYLHSATTRTQGELPSTY